MSGHEVFWVIVGPLGGPCDGEVVRRASSVAIAG